MTAQTTNRLLSSMRNGLPIVQITTLYEDLEAGLRAKLLLDLIQQQMGAPVRFKPEFWRFNWLEEQSQWDISLGTARTSALVIFSKSTANPLPEQMEKWVNAWDDSQNERTTALVLLSKERNGRIKHNSLNHRLQRVAERKHLDYFCEFFEPSRMGGMVPYVAAGRGARGHAASRDRASSKLVSA